MVFEKIEGICKERGISIARLEQETGLGNGTVRLWKTANPSTRTLKSVADYLGVSMDYLLCEDGKSEDSA